MLEPSASQRSLMLVLHDVAPETWPDYEPFVEAADALGNVPMTWLVVPDFHRRNPLHRAPTFCRLLDARLAKGDELALHGYAHADEGPAPRSPIDYFMRRIYTHEGEFYSLSRDAAFARLCAGIEVFDRYRWPLHGFVAPAWLMSDGTRQALRDFVRDDRATNLVGRHHQPPVDPDRAIGRAAAPAARSVADGEHRDGDARAAAIFRQIRRAQPLGFGHQPADQPGLERHLRPVADPAEVAAVSQGDDGHPGGASLVDAGTKDFNGRCWL